jgi:type II restriction enzyme
MREKIHIFFKVIADRILYAADANINSTKNIFLDVLNVVGDESKGEIFNRKTIDLVTILLNNEPIGETPVEEYVKYKNLLWKLIENNTETTFTSEEVENFLNSIHVFNPKSQVHVVNDFYNGKVNIVTEIEDRGGVKRILCFSCKSDSNASFILLNASGDNTNFVFEVTGLMDDEKMEHFNNIFKQTVRKGKVCYDIATSDRMRYLHEIGCDIEFHDTAKQITKTNLIKCGGMEMPAIVAGMLKKYYFENLSKSASVTDCVEYLAENDVVGYGFDDLTDTYRSKIAHMLLCIFTGLRLGSKWDGRQSVNGGYIVVKNNGDVVAFHSTISDEFKDFLVAKMHMESPSHSRHKDMVIYKEDGRYFIKLALQLRFSLSR